MVSVYDLSVQCASCKEIVDVEPPEQRKAFGWGLALTLGFIGLVIGLSVGVATAGFGMAATPFTLVIGLYAGYRIGVWSAEKKNGVECPECGSHVASK